MTEIVVVAPGWASTVQDAGRRGFGDLGVPPSGAVDEPLRQLLNRLVGNPLDAAVLETLGGLHVRVDGAAVVAVSADQAATSLRVGDDVVVEPADGALWAYLAVRGGIDVEPVLGSRSTDSRSGVGPASIRAGSRLPIGPDPGTPIVVDLAPPAPRRHEVLGVWPGPRVDWFAAGSLDVLVGATWAISSDVSRVGMRLDGPVLTRRVTGELPSEGLIAGAIQVPADGNPVVMLNDHPTTGGYPVLAVVDRTSLPSIAQRRPGSSVRFRVLQ